MELDVSGDYYIHCFYQRHDKRVYYMRISPDDSSLYGQAHLVKKESYGVEGVWFGSATGIIGGTNSNAFTGYEAYIAGSIKKISYLQAGTNVDLKRMTYSITPVFESDDNCNTLEE